MRTDLDKVAEAVGYEAFRRFTEADDLAQVPVPIVGIEFATIDTGPGHRRIERKVVGARREAGELAQGVRRVPLSICAQWEA